MGVVFFILNTLLFAFLCILFLFLLLLIIILFYPISYVIIADKNEKTYIDARCSWIFGLVGLYYLKKDETSETSLNVLWFKLNNGRNPKETANSREAQSESKPSSEKQDDKESHYQKLSEKVTGDGREDVEEDFAGKGFEEGDFEENAAKIPVKDKFENFKEKFSAMSGKVDFILQYPNKKEIFEYTWVLVKELFRAVNPKKLKLEAEIGFDDPSLTGYVLGGVYIARTMLKLNIGVEGNFQKQVINFSSYAKGKVALMPVLYSLAKYFLKKPVWKMVTDFRNRKEESDGR